MRLVACLLTALALSPAGVESAEANPISDENARSGTAAPPVRSISQSNIAGYTSQVSVRPGERLELRVRARPTLRYRVEILRLGWYRGTGARRVACLPSCTGDRSPIAQPADPTPDAVTGRAAAGWAVSDALPVPNAWPSGYYIARVVVTNGALAGLAATYPFVVTEPAQRRAPILVQVPTNTWQAYNNWAGKSLYASGSSNARAAVKVSFDRPFLSGKGPLEWEVQLVRFLEREGYDVAYATDWDVHRNPGLLSGRQLLVDAGHDEYWTREMRDAWQAARDRGTNLAFFGANTAYWQARFEDNGRTLVEYRSAAADPEPDPARETVRFRDLRPARRECELLGVQWHDGLREAEDEDRAMVVTGSAPSDPWLAGTGLTAGLALPDLVGYEWDAVQPGCGQPKVLLHYEGAPSDADAIRYTAPSGAKVFSSGSLQYSWALDDYAGHEEPADPRVQALTRNLLDDMAPGARAVASSGAPVPAAVVPSPPPSTPPVTLPSTPPSPPVAPEPNDGPVAPPAQPRALRLRPPARMASLRRGRLVVELGPLAEGARGRLRVQVLRRRGPRWSARVSLRRGRRARVALAVPRRARVALRRARRVELRIALRGRSGAEALVVRRVALRRG